VYRWPHEYAFRRILSAELVTRCEARRICRRRDCRSSNLSAAASKRFLTQLFIRLDADNEIT
jgi:hypothetical protein